MKSALVLFLTSLFTLATATSAPAEREWIWTAPNGKAKSHEVAYFRTNFDLPAVPAGAKVRFTCDNGATVVLNGQNVGHTEEWHEPVNVPATALHTGHNWVAVKATNDAGGTAAFILEIAAPGQPPVLVTNATWKFSSTGTGWDQPGTDIDDANILAAGEDDAVRRFAPGERRGRASVDFRHTHLPARGAGSVD